MSIEKIGAFSSTPSGALNPGVVYWSSTTNGVLCDGANYAQSSKSGLYGALGSRFTRSTNIHINGHPSKNRFLDTGTGSGDIASWSTGTSLPVASTLSQAFVTKDRVHLIVGHDASGASSSVYTAPINSDGTLGTWAAGGSLPVGVYSFNSLMTKDRVYLLGGDTGSVTSTVYTAPVNSDGTLGTWTTGTSLPSARRAFQTVVTHDRAYLFGGDTVPNGVVNTNGGASSTVYTAPINSDGTLGSWTTAASLPEGSYGSQFVALGSRVYMLGGANGTGVISTVRSAVINEDGTIGTWQTELSLPGARRYSAALVLKNKIYLVGGHDGTNYYSTTYYATLNSDGSIGSWSSGISIPAARMSSQVIATKDHVYVLGGYNGGYLSDVYYASVSGVGTNDCLTGTTLECYLPATSGSEFAVPRLAPRTNFYSGTREYPLITS